MPTRRAFLQAGAVLGAGALAGCGAADGGAAERGPGGERPNVLLVIADDLGVDAAPGYGIGARKPAMPTLDGLMRSGLTFDNAWSMTECTPTRAAMLTGRYGFRTRVGQVGDVLGADEIILHRILAEKTRYQTAVIGKWHVGPRGDAIHPTTMGVPHYAGFLEGALPSYTSWPLTQAGQTRTETGYATTVLADLAIAWLKERQRSADPWFLWLAFSAPHTPLHLPPASLHTRAGLSGTQQDIRQRGVEYFLAAAEALDAELGRVLSSLSEAARERTLIIFLGDNGSPPQVMQAFARGKQKSTPYQGGIAVPFVVSGAGVARRGERESALLCVVDVFATVLDAAKAAAPRSDGISLLPLFATAEPQARSYGYAEVFSGSGAGRPGAAPAEDGPSREGWAIRDTRHKLIRWADGTEEVYDLANDPLEERNLVGAGTDAARAALREAADALRRS